MSYKQYRNVLDKYNKEHKKDKIDVIKKDIWDKIEPEYQKLEVECILDLA